MTQRDRDRLVVLKKAQKKLIPQRRAAAELQLTERHVRRLLVRLKEIGDRAVVHELRQRPSHRRWSEQTRERTVRIPSEEVYRGFGPTLASEYLRKRHKDSDRPRSAKASDDAGGPVAWAQAEARGGSRVATAAEFPR